MPADEAQQAPPPLPITFTTPTLFLLLLVLLQLYQICVLVNADDSRKVTVKAISLLYNRKWDVKVVNAVNVGFNASLVARNWTVALGVNVEVARSPSYVINLVQFLNDYPKALNGDDANKLYNTLEGNQLVGFGPMTV
ncbi:uncharacterized protein TEOVI_000109800 [Trypanosoma equiperdum]|uniref:Uncharacterized protein n=1 Tax=Trypanosoma equiperdum TaxID=5694 RepID=A0A1G4IBM4_TRYEQ|nr:hypothetical protein TEOVI_000109800 [Trypanosoma equiperdum]